MLFCKLQDKHGVVFISLDFDESLEFCTSFQKLKPSTVSHNCAEVDIRNIYILQSQYIFNI